MNIDKKMSVLFIDKEIPIKNLLVFLCITAKVKNSYSLGPITSNENGLIELSLKKIEELIKKEQSDFPMDYGSELKDCVELIIKVNDVETLNKRVKAIAEYYPDDSKRIAKMVKGCANSLYKSHEYIIPLNSFGSVKSLCFDLNVQRK